MSTLPFLNFISPEGNVKLNIANNVLLLHTINNCHTISSSYTQGTFHQSRQKLSVPRSTCTAIYIQVEVRLSINQQSHQHHNPSPQQVCKHSSHGMSGVYRHSNKYALRHFLRAQCAFKILMIHEVLQFALRIAFRCVHHHCGSLDIHC